MRPRFPAWLVVPSIVLSAALASAAPLAAPAAFPRELVLAGGALAVCSDLASRACLVPPASPRRTAPRYRIDEAGRDRALDAALWSLPGAPSPDALEAMLATAADRLGDAEVDAATLEAALADESADAGAAARSPWSALTDSERSALLSALEVPQAGDGGARPTERAFPEASRDTGGVEVLRAFVAAAASRTTGRPRIAVVTASGADPMEAVDAYLATFRALGAEAVWWPVDAAMAAARFERGDCSALPALRRERLRLAQRERIYPDLADDQRAFCASQPALLLQVQGVFFAGGDQWRHRETFVRPDGEPNAWLQELMQAHVAGRLVVGGTSAGAAVQSARWMLTSGSAEGAVSWPARVGAPPEAGCSRGPRCDTRAEEALTLWPGGGLRLAEDAIVDTHFSERSRELRLLMAMQAADARWGYGADETSALRVRQFDDRREIDALGAAGGWVFRRIPGERDAVEAWYLAPGARLVVPVAGEPGAQLVIDRGGGAPVAPRERVPRSAFDPGALRTMAQHLAWRCDDAQPLAAGPGSAVLECAEEVRRWRGVNGVNGVGPLRLRWIRGAD